MYLSKTHKFIIAALILFVLYKLYQKREKREKIRNNDTGTNGQQPSDPIPTKTKKKTEDAEWSYFRNRTKKSDMIEQSFSI